MPLSMGCILGGEQSCYMPCGAALLILFSFLWLCTYMLLGKIGGCGKTNAVLKQ